VELEQPPRAVFGDPGPLARYAERAPFGVRTWVMKDHLYMLKYGLLMSILARSGIRYRSNFSRTKDDFERDQFMYRAFADAASAAGAASGADAASAAPGLAQVASAGRRGGTAT
jgi:hypothetical protein